MAERPSVPREGSALPATGPGAWECLRQEGGRLILTVYVQPGASRSEIAGLHGKALKVRVSAPPVEGRANDAVRDLLAAALDVPRSSLALVRGGAARTKWWAVQGLPLEEAKRRLGPYVRS